MCSIPLYLSTPELEEEISRSTLRRENPPPKPQGQHQSGPPVAIGPNPPNLQPCPKPDRPKYGSATRSHRPLSNSTPAPISSPLPSNPKPTPNTSTRYGPYPGLASFEQFTRPARIPTELMGFRAPSPSTTLALQWRYSDGALRPAQTRLRWISEAWYTREFPTHIAHRTTRRTGTDWGFPPFNRRPSTREHSSRRGIRP